jgi:hypothetical protein
MVKNRLVFRDLSGFFCKINGEDRKFSCPPGGSAKLCGAGSGDIDIEVSDGMDIVVRERLIQGEIKVSAPESEPVSGRDGKYGDFTFDTETGLEGWSFC